MVFQRVTQDFYRFPQGSKHTNGVLEVPRGVCGVLELPTVLEDSTLVPKILGVPPFLQLHLNATLKHGSHHFVGPSSQRDKPHCVGEHAAGHGGFIGMGIILILDQAGKGILKITQVSLVQGQLQAQHVGGKGMTSGPCRQRRPR